MSLPFTTRRPTRSEGRQHHGDLPGGIGRHEEAAEEAGARPLRGHHRRAGAVPPGARWAPAWWTTSSCARRAAGDRLLPPRPEACLSPTYGVIVYQEQVMQISQIIGGYTLGGADMLRRAMGKKKPRKWPSTATPSPPVPRTKGYDPALAEQLFDLMTKFAEYGFNKSHTAAYAVVSYHTAWLKAHHCAAFMAATCRPTWTTPTASRSSSTRIPSRTG
jgi:hypothetical protein